MIFVITLTVLAASKTIVLAETNVPAKELHLKTTAKTPTKGHMSTSPTYAYAVKYDPNANSLWSLHPSGQNSEQVLNDTRPLAFRPAFSLTRIAKSLNYGFDPSFKKGYFEPFERRPKPITLVAFRKNGLFPRQSVLMVKSDKNSEAAELQSPYNDIGSFWQDDMGSWK